MGRVDLVFLARTPHETSVGLRISITIANVNHPIITNHAEKAGFSFSVYRRKMMSAKVRVSRVSDVHFVAGMAKHPRPTDWPTPGPRPC